MRINGEWFVCDDDVVRPTVRGEFLSADGQWLDVRFLLDIGADRTVFDAALLPWLDRADPTGPTSLSGLGGVAPSVETPAPIRFTTDEGVKVVLRGKFAAMTRLEDLDMSVLGRDITRLFAVIVDQPGNVVCMLSQRHRYRIESF